MRDLTSVHCNIDVVASYELEVTASDQSTTFTFPLTELQSISDISWESSRVGGFSVPSTYNVSIISSLGFIKENINKLVRGETFLKVSVNSDDYTPHVGRIREFDVDAVNPNVFSIQVFDKFLDDNKKFPIAAIVDSYSTVHPNVIAGDFGYPEYFGKHVRPFYFTPVDCDIDSLIGPRNVSSENHVNSVWYNSDPSLSVESSEFFSTSVLMLKNWAQQSGSTNLLTGGEFFQVHDKVTGAMPLFKYPKSNLRSTNLSVASDGAFGYDNKSVTFWYLERLNLSNWDTLSIQLDQSIPFQEFQWINAYSIVSNVNSYLGTWLRIDVACFNDAFPITVASDSSNTTLTGCSALTSYAMQDGRRNTLLFTGRQAQGTSGNATITVSLNMSYSLRSDQYNDYSIAAFPVDCSDIAISENPVQIAQEILDQSTTNYVTSQFSQAQIDTCSYNFQCYFDKRQPISDILNEFGKITSTAYWVGDSGYINARTYQSSETLTSSNLINAVITSSDYLEGSFRLFYNPLGTTTFAQTKYRRVKVDYNYDFARGQYLNNVVADPSNNSFCDSIDAAGISNELTVATKHIVEGTTAGYYKDNLVRNGTLQGAVVEMSLPARYFTLEQNDIARIEHPFLPDEIIPYDNIVERSNPKNYRLNAVTFGDDLFVAVGEADGGDAYIVTSPDGVTWTERSNPKNRALNSVAYGNGLFVAVGDADGTDAYILTSTNGTSWTERGNPKNFRLNSVVYGNSLFVAVGDDDGADAYIVTSTDGVAWTERSNPKNFELFGVGFGNNIFTAVGNDDRFDVDAYVLSSTDGITWTERSNPDNSRIYFSDYCNDLFIAGGETNSFMYSENGTTWAAMTTNFSPTRSAAYGDGLYVCVGDGGSNLQTSSDGKTDWTNRTLPKSFTLYSVTFSPVGKFFVAVGDADGTDAFIVTISGLKAGSLFQITKVSQNLNTGTVNIRGEEVLND